MTANFRNIGETMDYAARMRDERDKARNERDKAHNELAAVKAENAAMHAELKNLHTFKDVTRRYLLGNGETVAQACRDLHQMLKDGT